MKLALRNHRPASAAAGRLDLPGAATAAVVGPDRVEVGARRLRLGAGYCATFAVTGYPATVGGVFLETIFSWPGV